MGLDTKSVDILEKRISDLQQGYTRHCAVLRALHQELQAHPASTPNRDIADFDSYRRLVKRTQEAAAKLAYVEAALSHHLLCHIAGISPGAFHDWSVEA